MRARTDGRLRVAMVIQGFHPRVGGAERQLQAVAPRLRAAGIDVQIVTRRHPGLSAFSEVDGVPVHRVGTSGPKALASAAFTVGAVDRLRRLRPDVIHAHELLSPTTVAVIAGVVTGAPVVVKVLISGEVRYLRDERPLGRQRLAVFRRRVDAFVTISRDIDDELAAVGVPAERRHHIPNGVDVERYRPPTAWEREEHRWRHRLGPGPTIVFVGRLEPQKNLRQLVEVFARVRDRHPGAELLLAGEGSEERPLRELAGPGVRLLGELRDVTGLFQAADVFVLPSWREGLSNALLEAMACGLPVVVTAVGGATEVVDQGRSGLLVDPGDATELQAALETLVADPGRRLAMGTAARQEIVDRYALTDRVEEFRRLYRKVTA